MPTAEDTTRHEQIPGTYGEIPADVADLLRRSEMACRVFAAGMSYGHALALTEMVSDLKAAGEMLRNSPLWNPNRPSWAEMQRRIQERYRQSPALSGPELVARAHESWGLTQARRSA